MTADEYRNLRLGADMTQAELASRLGVTIHCIQDRENNRQRITDESAVAIRAVCGRKNAEHPAAEKT